LGDLYGIKAVIDRVEEGLSETGSVSVAQKLLFVDKYEKFRFIKLHTSAFGEIRKEDFLKEYSKTTLLTSEEYRQCSDSTKSVCENFLNNFPDKVSFEHPKY
ncbi:hypothetical protein PMAYCL1PPCAC_25713, partial [Pristionchus mayeri]